MILIIDNYDSFVFNIYQYISELSSDEILCVRNDKITLNEIKSLSPTHIILSPGPKHPADCGVCLDVLKSDIDIPILGVCLGHQAIGLVAGANIKRQNEPKHGKTSLIKVLNEGKIFEQLPNEFEVMRYHSLYVDDLPDNLEILAVSSDDNIVMAMRDKNRHVYGIQFHPESYFSEYGKKIISNFLNIKPSPLNQVDQKPDLKKYLVKLQENEKLDDRDFADICSVIATGQFEPVQLAALLVLISEKSLYPQSLVALTQNILKYSKTFRDPTPMIDLCGTGGDGFKSINISTTTAFILASLGIKVAKHGNKAVSSVSGSSDVISSINLKMSENINEQRKLLDESGLAFFHAPYFHSLVGMVKDVRANLGIRTVFNILGPLLNPNLSLRNQLVGVYHKPVLKLYAQTLGLLGRKHALVVRGDDGMDEVSLCDSTRVVEIKDGIISEYSVTPEQFGFKRATHADIAGGDSKENAEILKAILKGDERGAKRDIVVLNAMFGLYAADGVDCLTSARCIIEDAIDSGKAWSYFNNYTKRLCIE